MHRHSSLERGLKNVAGDAQRYLQKGTWTGKSENRVWFVNLQHFPDNVSKISSKFQYIFINGFKRQAIINIRT